MEDGKTPATPTGEMPASGANQPTQDNPNPANNDEGNKEPAPALTPNIPQDMVEAFNRFVDNNGGFKKAFSALKTAVSTPRSQDQPAQPAQPVQPAQPAQQATLPVEPPAGYMTQSEFAIQQYFDSLANLPQYASVAEQIRDGSVIKEMGKFDITPLKDGMINDGKVRAFLDMYSKTVAPPTPAEPLTNTPTVEYINVGDAINSRDDALAVLNQNRTLRQRGEAEHPMTQAANDYLKQYFSNKHSKPLPPVSIQ